MAERQRGKEKKWSLFQACPPYLHIKKNLLFFLLIFGVTELFSQLKDGLVLKLTYVIYHKSTLRFFDYFNFMYCLQFTTYSEMFKCD